MDTKKIYELSHLNQDIKERQKQSRDVKNSLDMRYDGSLNYPDLQMKPKVDKVKNSDTHFKNGSYYFDELPQNNTMRTDFRPRVLSEYDKIRDEIYQKSKYHYKPFIENIKLDEASNPFNNRYVYNFKVKNTGLNLYGGNMPMDEEQPTEEYELAKPDLETTEPYRTAVFSESLPEHAPPNIRNLLNTWGDATIFKMRICRIPLNGAIKKLGNFLTMGKLTKNMRRMGYDDLFHLYMDMALRNKDGKVINITLEKNQKVDWSINHGGIKAGGVCVEQPITKPITLNQMFKNAEKTVGANRLWVYDLRTQNCQVFIGDMLNASKMLSRPTKAFILQEPAQLLPPLLLKLTKKATDWANKVRSYMYGKGMAESESDDEEPEEEY